MTVAPPPALIDLWLGTFADGPPTVRVVLDRALDGAPRLLDLLDQVFPGFRSHPHPGRLTAWLTSIENLPVVDGDDRPYRFARVGHRWLVKPLLAASDQTRKPDSVAA